MTNKEAIEILRDQSHFFSVGYSMDGKIRNERDEALIMAISALEKLDERSKLAEERADAIKAFEAEKKEGISLLRSLHLSEDDICEITNRVNMLDLAIKALKKANREEE